MAHQFVSPIKRRKNSETIREPLAVLCLIGQLGLVAKHVCYHAQLSRRYELRAGLKCRRITVKLTPLLLAKRERAEEWRDKRLNRKFPFRKQLLTDMPRLQFAQSARPLIAELQKANKGGGGLASIVHAIDTEKHSIEVNTLGTIHTALSSIPKEVKAHLTFCGEKPALCDVSHMHHCLLPRLLADRMSYLEKEHPGTTLRSLNEELTQLSDFLSTGDYYRKWCDKPADDAERAKVKKAATTLLNMRTESCVRIPLYQRMRKRFPRVFEIIEDIKRENNGNLSKQLQRYTSDAINGALLELQREHIPAIPDTDAILCRERDREHVCHVIGKHVHAVSGGVRCKVGGIRYVGSLLEWDDEAPSDDELSYDEWEERRTARRDQISRGADREAA